MRDCRHIDGTPRAERVTMVPITSRLWRGRILIVYRSIKKKINLPSKDKTEKKKMSAEAEGIEDR